MVTAEQNASRGQGGAGLPAPFSLKEFDETMVTVRTALFGEKEFNALKNYLTTEGSPVPDRKAIGDLFNLSRDLVQKIARDLRRTKAELAKVTVESMAKDEQIDELKKEISALKERNVISVSEVPSDEGSISEIGMDSVDLAKAMCWRSKENGHILYRNQMQTMLYIMYVKCLARQGARMTREHPQAWEFGPVFPRVYSKVKSTDDESFREQSDALKEANPQMSDLLDETVSRCSWRGCREMLAYITAKGTPCEASRSRNEGKKTAPMEDAEIRQWFTRRNS